MSNQPPTLNYHTPNKRPRWPTSHSVLVLLILCATIALFGSWELHRARQAARLARQAELRQLLIQRKSVALPILRNPAPARLGPTTVSFMSIPAGDGDGARPVFAVPAHPPQLSTRPADSQESQ